MTSTKKLQTIVFACFAFIFSTLHFACTYNKENELYPQPCDTSNVRFSVEIKNILNAHCASCHYGNATGGDGLKLETYEEVKSAAENKIFLESVISDINPMPQNAPRLSACKINQIRAWINQGMKNN
jgi:uncharacterized membrane protein